MEDAEILQLYRARDARAIEETREKYGGLCLSVASNLLHVREDAEECVADTYLAAWNAIPPERPSILRAFLAKLTRNIALDKLKRLRAQKRGGGETELVFEELSELLPGGTAPGAELERRELLRDIESFLGAESPRARLIFLRRYFYADSVSAIARGLGMRENAVSAQLSRTRKRLRVFLKERGYQV